jgi:hypothetical protein
VNHAGPGFPDIEFLLAHVQEDGNVFLFLDVPKVMALGLSYFTFEMPFAAEGNNAVIGDTFCVYDPSAKFTGYGVFTGFDTFWFALASYDKYSIDDFRIGPWVSVLGTASFGSIKLHDEVRKRYNDNRHPENNSELSFSTIFVSFNYDFVLGVWETYYFAKHATAALGIGYTYSIRGIGCLDTRYGVSDLDHHGFIRAEGFNTPPRVQSPRNRGTPPWQFACELPLSFPFYSVIG